MYIKEQKLWHRGKFLSSNVVFKQVYRDEVYDLLCKEEGSKQSKVQVVQDELNEGKWKLKNATKRVVSDYHQIGQLLVYG